MTFDTAPNQIMAERSAGQTAMRVNIDAKLLGAIADTGSAEEAIQLAERLAHHLTEAEHGAELAKLAEERHILVPAVARRTAELDRIEDALAIEPEQIHAPQENGGSAGNANTDTETPLSGYQLRDKINGALSLLGAIAIGLATYFGVYATFATSGLDIFYEADWLLVFLPVLPVCLSIMIKQAGMAFGQQVQRDIYRRFVIFAGIGAGLLWVPLYSGIYTGMSGVFDPYAETSKGMAFAYNATHLLAETLIGAGLFATLDAAVLAKYAPSHKIDNPARPALIDAGRRAHTALSPDVQRLGTIVGREREIAGMNGVIQIYLEAAIRQKVNETPRDSLL